MAILGTLVASRWPCLKEQSTLNQGMQALRDSKLLTYNFIPQVYTYKEEKEKKKMKYTKLMFLNLTMFFPF